MKKYTPHPHTEIPPITHIPLCIPKDDYREDLEQYIVDENELKELGYQVIEIPSLDEDLDIEED